MTDDRHVYVVTKILAASKINDIAILKVDFKKDKMVPLAIGETAEEGSDVFVMGNPSHMTYYFTRGIVARNFIRDPAHPKPGEDFRMAITAEYSVGESGGPVVNEFGNLVGMVSTTTTLFGTPEKQENPQMVVKSAIPIIAIKQLLK
jgi:S1-C subfamily serine protease